MLSVTDPGRRVVAASAERKPRSRNGRSRTSTPSPEPENGAGDVVVGTTWQFQVNLMQAEGQPIAGVDIEVQAVDDD